MPCKKNEYLLHVRYFNITNFRTAELFSVPFYTARRDFRDIPKVEIFWAQIFVKFYRIPVNLCLISQPDVRYLSRITGTDIPEPSRPIGVVNTIFWNPASTGCEYAVYQVPNTAAIIVLPGAPDDVRRMRTSDTMDLS
jgi:hypothetical protein